MGISKAGKQNGMIQFAAGRPELPGLIKEDVKRSSYKDATKYYNALSERIVAAPIRLGSKSCLEEIFKSLDLVAQLPLEVVEEIASTQNRNWNQMLVHILEEGIMKYPLPQPYGDTRYNLPFTRSLTDLSRDEKQRC